MSDEVRRRSMRWSWPTAWNSPSTSISNWSTSTDLPFSTQSICAVDEKCAFSSFPLIFLCSAKRLRSLFLFICLRSVFFIKSVRFRRKNLIFAYWLYKDKNMEKQALNRIKVMLTEHMLTNKPTWTALSDWTMSLLYRFGVKSNTENIVSFEHNDLLKGTELLGELIESALNHQPLNLLYRTFAGKER